VDCGGARLAERGCIGDWFCEDSTSRDCRGRHPKVRMPGESFGASPGTKVPPGLAMDAALGARSSASEAAVPGGHWRTPAPASRIGEITRGAR